MQKKEIDKKKSLKKCRTLYLHALKVLHGYTKKQAAELSLPSIMELSNQLIS